MLPVTGLSVFATHRPRDHLLRGVSQSISQTSCFWLSARMPLAGGRHQFLRAAVCGAGFDHLTALFAGFVRGSALVIGFLGVLIVTNPGANSLTLGALF